IVALVGRVLHVARRNRQNLGRIATALALGRLRNLVIGDRSRSPALVGRNLRQRSRQRRLPMINVTDRANVAVRLRPLEFCLRHGGSPVFLFQYSPDAAARRKDFRDYAYFALTSSATLRGTSA